MESIKVVIKNESNAFTLETSPNENIAGVKAAYQESGCCTKQSNYIVLLHKGKELTDEKTLAELGITDGDTLVHMEAAHEPFHALNYKALSQSIKLRRRHEDTNLQELKEDNIWAAGQDGIVHRMGPGKSLISRMPSSGKSSTSFSTKSGSTRSFFNQLSIRVNGCSYHILPSIEGRWNGELTTVPSTDDGSQVCSSDLIFREDECVWSQRQSRTTISGLTSTQHSWIKPVADGICKVETDDPMLRGCNISMQELGTNVLIISATSKRSGRPIMVETITIIDSSCRIRTVQRFDESGAFRSVYVMNERRVMDSVSGAMEKYENAF